MEIHNSTLTSPSKGSRDLTGSRFLIEHGPYARRYSNVGASNRVSLVGPRLRFELPNQLLMAASMLQEKVIHGDPDSIV
jgi:hypothetical protein